MRLSQQKNITPQLLQEINDALEHVGSFGSIEIYVQHSQVTQITIRKINKTKHQLNGKSKRAIGQKVFKVAN